MNDDYLNEPDHLERVLRGITSADDLREMTIHMTTSALEDYSEFCKTKPDDELVKGLQDGTLAIAAKEYVDSRFDETLRRWLIKKGYL